MFKRYSFSVLDPSDQGDLVYLKKASHIILHIVRPKDLSTQEILHFAKGVSLQGHLWQRIMKKWGQGLASSPRQKCKGSSQKNGKADGQGRSERPKQDDDSTSKFIKIFGKT